MNANDPIPSAQELRELIALALVRPADEVEVHWTKRLVSFAVRRKDSSPFAVTKRLPITYGQLKHLLLGLGITE